MQRDWEVFEGRFLFCLIVFSNLPVALVGNIVFEQKRTLGELKVHLRLPRTIPVAILLVEISQDDHYVAE
jgi:hypothetical protein